jgi:hypothetical protein
MLCKKSLPLVLMFALTSRAQITGVIQGIVRDGSDVPVVHATVYARPQGIFVFRAIEPHTETDREGRYRLEVPFGQYSLAAGNPDEGYPDALYYTFYYGHKRRHNVALSAKNSKATVNLRLAKKAGILVGTVTDASTGKPVNANVEFRWISDPTIAISGSGLANFQFRILIPSDTPLSMVISQSGYENWVYRNITHRLPLVLGPGESMNLDIRLKPDRAEALSP